MNYVSNERFRFNARIGSQYAVRMSNRLNWLSLVISLASIGITDSHLVSIQVYKCMIDEKHRDLRFYFKADSLFEVGRLMGCPSYLMAKDGRRS